MPDDFILQEGITTDGKVSKSGELSGRAEYLSGMK